MINRILMACNIGTFNLSHHPTHCLNFVLLFNVNPFMVRSNASCIIFQIIPENVAHLVLGLFVFTFNKQETHMISKSN